MQSLISPENSWALWSILIGIAALSIWLEQTYQWAAKVTGAIIGLVIAMVLANLRIIPTDAPTYDVVWGYVVPLAIPLLLFQANIRKFGGKRTHYGHKFMLCRNCSRCIHFIFCPS